MSDLYAVFGNPIAHSKSPAIHTGFGASAGQDIVYEARLAPVDGFAQAIAEFVAAGGKGANVTVPFKEDAFRLATRLSDRAARDGAVNTLAFADGEDFGDNTNGAGLVRDITITLVVSDVFPVEFEIELRRTIDFNQVIRLAGQQPRHILCQFGAPGACNARNHHKPTPRCCLCKRLETIPFNHRKIRFGQ